VPVSAKLQALESLLRQEGWGKTLPSPGQRKHPPAPSGVAEVDTLLGGGLPRGRISEFMGRCSSGRTSLAFSLLAQATQAGEAAVYVDAADSLDPGSAEQAGIALERLLWVRCDPRARARPGRAVLREMQVDQAWQAVNLVVSAGGFGIVVLDLGGLPRGKLRQWQGRPWVRLFRAIENSATLLLVLAETHLAGSAAGLVLELSREETHWSGGPGALLLLDGVSTVVRPLHWRAKALGA